MQMGLDFHSHCHSPGAQMVTAELCHGGVAPVPRKFFTGPLLLPESPSSPSWRWWLQGCPFGSLSGKGLHLHRGNGPPSGVSSGIMPSENLPTPLSRESGLPQVVLIAKKGRTWGGGSGRPGCHSLSPHRTVSGPWDSPAHLTPPLQ